MSGQKHDNDDNNTSGEANGVDEVMDKISDDDFLSSSMTHREVVRDFVDTTSINGLSRLFVKNKVRKFIWTVIVIGTCLCFAVHFYFMLDNYLQYSTNTDSTIIENGFDFPDITMCAKNPYDSDKSTEDAIGIHQATEFWKYLLSDLSKKKTNTRNFETYAEQLAYLSFLSFANDRDVYVDLRKHIHYCTYNGMRCRPRDFSVHKLSSRLNCLTFHPHNRKLNSPGVRDGLRLIMDTGRAFDCLSKYAKILKTTGMELTIHENGTLPTVKQKSFLIQAGKVSDISLVMKKYEKISTPIKSCHSTKREDQWVLNLHTDSASIMTYYRDKNTCNIMAQQKLALERCHCWRDDELIPWKNTLFHSSPKRFPLCHQIPLEYFNNSMLHSNNGTLISEGESYALNRNNSVYVKIIRNFLCHRNLGQFESTLTTKTIDRCGNSCETLNYEPSFANYDYELDFKAFKENYMEFYGRFRLVPVDDLQKLFQSLNNFDGKNILALNIYASDLHVEETEESLAYPLTEFLSDFGGNIGLWIGCTVITLVEILELLLRLTYVKLKEKKAKKLARGNYRESEPMNQLRFEMN